ncbi:unnamed protein product [Paramecium octaurelia]|uniref:Uncharacterized protein n=1 Tax=Paramecium octaurelia TaxID=43137 RepID=A0A8S1YLZ5_PAROT|nr:unnamed protein product [Paramecium octaurelia]
MQQNTPFQFPKNWNSKKLTQFSKYQLINLSQCKEEIKQSFFFYMEIICDNYIQSVSVKIVTLSYELISRIDPQTMKYLFIILHFCLF